MAKKAEKRRSTEEEHEAALEKAARKDVQRFWQKAVMLKMILFLSFSLPLTLIIERQKTYKTMLRFQRLLLLV
jgi:hypothetical protein